MLDNPQLLAKVKKKLNTLTLDYKGNKLELEIIDGEIDIIKIDVWISDILFKEYEKAQLRKKLTGEKDVGDMPSFKGFNSL